MTSDDGFIIELLIKKNAASDIAVQSAREAIKEEGEVVTETLLLERLIDDLNIPNEEVLLMLANEFNMEIGHVNEVLLADEVKEFFPYNVVQKYKIFPLSITDAEAEIAIADPFNLDTVDNISHMLNRPLVLRLSSTSEIESAINANYDESLDSINAAFASATEALSGGGAQAVVVGEETGELDKMLNRVADNYDEDVDNAVAGITSIIEPIMIVFLALAVGFIVIALFLPIVEIIKQLTG